MDNKIIFALDVYGHDTAINMAKELGDKIFAIKVNWPLILENGIKIVDELSKYSPVICDFKLADITNTVRLVTEKAREHKAYGIIAHAFTGIESLKSVVASAGNMKVFSVVSMSQESFLDDVTGKLIDVSKKAGVYGVVAPGNRPYYLKTVKDLAAGLKIISPGVGAQGGNITEALLLGADYVIIGRSIYESDDPLGSIDRLNNNVNSH
ncbi:MAG: orotidine-5'-phosphate decarboxylase [Ferroplasma sp.]